ncbi:hypothetical protein AB0K48_23675 [Nonomuraea sp. NPDC055795]
MPSLLLPMSRHIPFLAVLVPAIALRGLAIHGYPPALFFWADSFTYLRSAAEPVPGTFRPLGYSLFLAVLGPGQSLALVTTVQHLLGLGLAVAAYALLRRHGLPGWGATLAVTPVLYDEFLILLEHMIMADALFTVLATGGIVILLRRITPVSGACAGLLLALATLTRTIGAVVLLLTAAYLLWRGRHALIPHLLAAGAPLIAYACWMAVTSGTFGLTKSEGIFLWSRTMSFADCSVIKPEPRLAVLCPDQPVGERPAAPFWLWQPASPLYKVPGEDRNALAGQFARTAVAAQPGDYLAAVGRDMRWLLRWERTTDRSVAVRKTNPYWFPFEPRPLKDSAAAAYEGEPLRPRIAEPYAGLLRVYQRFGYLPIPLLLALLAGALATALIRRRHDALLPALAATALILAPLFTAGFDVRYVVPAIPLVCVAAGLAVVPGGQRQDVARP